MKCTKKIIFLTSASPLQTIYPGSWYLYLMSQKNQRKCAPNRACLSSPDLLPLPNLMTRASILSCQKLESHPRPLLPHAIYLGITEASLFCLRFFYNRSLPPNLHSCGHSSVLCHLSLDYCKTFWLACLSSLREVQPPAHHWRHPSIKMQVRPTHSSENRRQGSQWSLWRSSVLPASNLHSFLTQGD